ncbi:MAG: DHH family phosphoesterase [Candidatus Diapherotrites archaeon]|nr:DHH family phosphoesterase [Candidatus Diapherotrites archaeon]
MNQGFVQKAKEIAKELKERDHFLVVYNHDADGISSGAIIATALKRLGKNFEVKVLKQLYVEEIRKIAGTAQNYLFIDFGSGQLKELKEIIKENFFVLDHHQPQKEEWQHHLNPLLFGIDGGEEISAAGVAYAVAKCVDKKNSDLAALAVVGAIGDMQDSSGQLVGFNREILSDAVSAGVISTKTGLRLYGRISRPLIQFLQFSSSPIIPMLTANEQNCLLFLQGLGIELKEGEQWRCFEDLSKQEQEKFSSALIVHMHKWNVPEWKIQSLIGEIYSLEKEHKKSPLHDAKEFGTLLNSCGRHGLAKVGLAVCMGDRKENYPTALAMLAEHRRQLREGLELVKENGIKEFEGFYFFDAGGKVKDSIIGIVAGMLYGSGVIAPTKPIIALVENSDGSLKASGRATSELVRNGLNLGKIFKEMQVELGEGTEGGGHRPAAGIKFPKPKKQEFLALLDKKIKEQLA